MTAVARAVLVASPDRLYAEAAAAYLDGLEGWRTVGVARDGVEALSAMGRLQPAAVLVLDELPRLGAAALARQVRRRWSGTTVVVLGELEAPDAHVLPPEADGAAVLEALSSSPAEAALRTEESADAMARLTALTPRERDVLRLLARGEEAPRIAEELGASRHTVRTHMQNLYRKLDCHSRLEVVSFAAQHGLVEAGGATESS